MLRDTSRNLDMIEICELMVSDIRFPLFLLLTYVSGTILIMFSTMSSSKLISIASGVISSFILARRKRMISSLVGVMDIATTFLARRFSTSPQMWKLQVRNTLVLGELPKICFSKSSTLIDTRAGIHPGDQCR